MRRLATELAILPTTLLCAAGQSVPIDIGTRRELLVDDFLIEKMVGDVRLQLNRPTRGEIVFRTDAEWEGNASAFQSVFRDGDVYRMYYRGGHYRHSGEPAQAHATHPWVLCYAESNDGINWRRPELGLIEFNGSKANNIIVDTNLLSETKCCPAHTAVFNDVNPNCPAAERYKMVATRFADPKGLYIYGSPDGLRFSLLSKEPIVTHGYFDSQNLVFWDTVNNVYREYHRHFNKDGRGIMTSTSRDVRHFPEPAWVTYTGTPPQELYTNQVQPYYRAPHILMGFPMRYTDRTWTAPVIDLPGLDERLARAKHHPRYGSAITDAVFMTSRDGVSFRRWPEAFIRPGPGRKDTWVYADNFVFWGMVETASPLPEAPPDISLYATEGYWEGTYTSIRRYTTRQDGFVSALASFAGGEIVTKPLTFSGGNLELNLSTSGAGSLQVEIQAPDGTPIKGYSLAECPEILGDELAYRVRWTEVGGDVRPLAGRPVRLRFVLRDADLYAFQFPEYSPDPVRPDVAASNSSLPEKNARREPFTVLDDDFMTAEAGTSPTDADLNPPTGDGDSGWCIAEGSPDRVQVLNDDPVGSGKAGANHYLKIERRDETRADGGCAWLVLLRQDAADSKDGVIDVKARIYVPASNEHCVQIDGYDNKPNLHHNRAFHVRFYPDGTVRYFHMGRTYIVKDLTIKRDCWQDVSIRADAAEAMLDVTVDGKTATDVPFADPGVHRIQSIAFGPNSRQTTMYLDSVSVRVTPNAKQ